MIRIISCAVFCMASCALGQVLTPPPRQVPASPATRPLAVSRPTTKPSLDELHRQAVEYMRQDDWAKAAAAMKPVYAARPPQDQSRPVILNQAIIDIAQKVTTPRAVRDLTIYLTRHRDSDELATNVLGAALNIAADTGRFRQTPIFQAAVKEWERRNYVLEQSRPDSHRWGAEWLTPEQWEALEQQRFNIQRQVDLLTHRVEQAEAQVQVLRETRQQILDDSPDEQDLRLGTAYTGPLSPDELRGRRGMTAQELQASLALERRVNEAEAKRVSQEIRDAADVVAAEQHALKQAKQSFPRPRWPTRFDPVEPEAQPIPPATQPITPAASP